MAKTHELPPEGRPNGKSGQDDRGTEVVADGSSLMLCSPLIPQYGSLVEIAETEYVSANKSDRTTAESHRSPLYQTHTVDDIDEESESEDNDGRSVENHAADGGQPNNASESKSIFRWLWFGAEEEKFGEQKAKEEKQVEAGAKEGRKFKKRNEKVLWVPSPTKLSLQTMWWGYRMSVDFKARRIYS